MPSRKKISKARAQKFIGCSGYYYPQWRGNFYPKTLKPSEWLNYYSTFFNSVELNGTFYRQPKPIDLKKQRNATPDDFRFSVKMSRYVTHILRLKESKTRINEFTDLITNGLESKLHYILLQMPPSFHFKEDTWQNLLENVPDNPLYVIEFRHASWWNEEVLKVMAQRKNIFCNVDFPGLQPPFTGENKNFYLRMHGVPELFKSEYSKKRLLELYNLFPECDSYTVYFNNTYYGAAYENAKQLIKLFENK